MCCSSPAHTLLCFLSAVHGPCKCRSRSSQRRTRTNTCAVSAGRAELRCRLAVSASCSDMATIAHAMAADDGWAMHACMHSCLVATSPAPCTPSHERHTAVNRPCTPVRTWERQKDTHESQGSCSGPCTCCSVALFTHRKKLACMQQHTAQGSMAWCISIAVDRMKTVE